MQIHLIPEVSQRRLPDGLEQAEAQQPRHDAQRPKSRDARDRQYHEPDVDGGVNHRL